MTTKTVWICDGCDEERNITRLKQGDWHMVTISTDGFRGYPTCAAEPSEPSTYHLCQDCVTRLHGQINPRMWPRSVQQAAPAEAA